MRSQKKKLKIFHAKHRMCFASWNSRSEFPNLKKSKKRRRREAPFGDAFCLKNFRRKFFQAKAKVARGAKRRCGTLFVKFLRSKNFPSEKFAKQIFLFRKISDRLLVDRCSEIFILKK